MMETCGHTYGVRVKTLNALERRRYLGYGKKYSVWTFVVVMPALNFETFRCMGRKNYFGLSFNFDVRMQGWKIIYIKGGGRLKPHKRECPTNTI